MYFALLVAGLFALTQLVLIESPALFVAAAIAACLVRRVIFRWTMHHLGDRAEAMLRAHTALHGAGPSPHLIRGLSSGLLLGEGVTWLPDGFSAARTPDERRSEQKLRAVVAQINRERARARWSISGLIAASIGLFVFSETTLGRAAIEPELAQERPVRDLRPDTIPLQDAGVHSDDEPRAPERSRSLHPSQERLHGNHPKVP